MASSEAPEGWSIVLRASGPHRIRVIKVVRSALGISLQSAWDALTLPPNLLARGLPRAQAEGLAQQLTELDATVELCPPGVPLNLEPRPPRPTFPRLPWPAALDRPDRFTASMHLYPDSGGAPYEFEFDLPRFFSCIISAQCHHGFPEACLQALTSVRVWSIDEIEAQLNYEVWLQAGPQCPRDALMNGLERIQSELDDEPDEEDEDIISRVDLPVARQLLSEGIAHLRRWPQGRLYWVAARTD